MVKQRSFAIISVVFAVVFVVLLVMLLITGYSIEKFAGQAESFFAAYSHIGGMKEIKGQFARLTKDAALEFFILTGAALLTTLVLVAELPMWLFTTCFYCRSFVFTLGFRKL